MKKFLSLLLTISCLITYGQTVPITTVEIPTSADDLNRPGGGAEQWTFGQNTINIPNQSTSTTRVTAYFRYPWYAIQSPNATGPGLNMDFSQFDRDMQDAITKGQITGFGYLVNFGDQAPSIGGAKRVYPQALHTAMQAEGVHDFINGDYWYENPNSAAWLSWLQGLFNATIAHINSTSFNGVAYSSVIKVIDIRIIGDFGEGAVLGVGPTPTSTACNAIIDAYKAAFHQFYLTAMIGNFSGGQPGPTGTGITPLATSTYLLKTVTDKGPVGWRRDNYGQVDNYIRLWTDLNPVVDAGYHYDTTIQNRYRQAPVRGEPQDGGPGFPSSFGAGDFGDFVTQVQRDHTQTFGNGNFNGAINATIQNNFRAASKASGYRLVCGTGTATQTPIAGGPWGITLNWKNVNGVPTYDKWNVIYEWKNSSGTVVQRFTSVFQPYLFRSTTNVATTESFNLTTVPAGTGYTVSVRLEDQFNYMKPMPLFINGRDASGAYPLLTNVTVTSSGAVANAGVNQTITVPTVTLSSSSSISATSQIWSNVSGPNTPTITTPTTVGTTVTGLITGTYVFKVSINGGSTGPLISTVTVIVNLPVPIANAGPNQNITTTSTTLNGSGSTNSSVYLWTFISGPNTPTIVSPTTVTTSVTGLITGTYIFKLAVNGGTVSPQISQVSIIVNATPVQANAGNNQTITLPVSTATLNGGASTGVISWAWANVSGPTTATITNPGLGVTTVTGLVAGVYIFQLSINSGASSSQTTVTVLPAPVVIANAGSNQTITLPVNTVGFNGSASVGAISYLWTNISGPTVPVILTPTLVTAGAANLIQGTYVFDLSINGGVSHSRITVVVLPAPLPVANAGSSKTVSLPLSVATLDASLSTGIISTYTWTMVSGPNTPTLTGANAPIATVSNLIIGTYVFRITLNGGSNDTMRVFVNPIPSVGTGTTVFTAQTPAGGGNTLTDGVQLEVGMKFRSSINTYVTGIRFYKSGNNIGTHIGELYSYPAGVRLAQVTFTSETLTGWQIASFFPAVPITAGTTYIISYWSSLGFYTSTNNYFTTAVTNSPLTGLADGTDGPNGVFRYTNTPAFPNATFQKANYWVDPITNPSPPDYILRTGTRNIYVKEGN